jgi:hypothetical protein
VSTSSDGSGGSGVAFGDTGLIVSDMAKLQMELLCECEENKENEGSTEFRCFRCPHLQDD